MTTSEDEQARRLPVREIRVLSTTRVGPRTARVTFGGDDLADLVERLASMGPDQQVKLYFPRPGQHAPRLPAGRDGDAASWYAAYVAVPEHERPWMRSYTIRAHDTARGTIDVDFVLHEHAGPATRWALAARRGDVLAMYGPDGEYARRVPLSVPIASAGWVLMVGDETALPGMGTIAEALPPGTRAVAVVEVAVEVADAAGEQPFVTDGNLTVRWVHRGSTPPGHGTALVDALRATQFPPGRVFAWLAGEAGVVRTLRRHLVADRGVDKRDIEFAGYWRLRRTQDDPPTAEDMADAQEVLALAAEAGRGTPRRRTPDRVGRSG